MTWRTKVVNMFQNFSHYDEPDNDNEWPECEGCGEETRSQDDWDDMDENTYCTKCQELPMLVACYECGCLWENGVESKSGLSWEYQHGKDYPQARTKKVEKCAFCRNDDTAKDYPDMPKISEAIRTIQAEVGKAVILASGTRVELIVQEIETAIKDFEYQIDSLFLDWSFEDVV